MDVHIVETQTLNTSQKKNRKKNSKIVYAQNDSDLKANNKLNRVQTK